MYIDPFNHFKNHLTSSPSVLNVKASDHSIVVPFIKGENVWNLIARIQFYLLCESYMTQLVSMKEDLKQVSNQMNYYF